MLRKAFLIVVTGVLLAAGAANAETIRWTRSGDSLTLDPHAQNEGPTHSIAHQMYETLVQLDMDLKMQPSLSTKWYVKPGDSNTWVFELRKGVRFHEGQELTAEDVVFSINRARHEHSDMRGLLSSVKEVRAAGPHKVEIETNGPNPLLPNNLTNLFIMNKAWAEKHNVTKPQNYAEGEENYAVRHVNGTGPYKLVSRNPDVRTEMELFDGYWGKDQYPLEVSRIIFTPIASAATRVAALMSGEVDLLLEAPVQDVERLKSARALRIEQGPENRVIFLGMNQTKPKLESSSVDGNPFADRRVREAMNLAIDATAIQKAVMRGNSQPAGVIAPPFVNGYSQELDQRAAADQKRARKLLADAGYEKGFDVTLHCPNDRYVNDEQICQAVVGMLGRVGIKVSLVSQPRSVHFAELSRGEQEFYMLGWGVPTLDSEYIFNYLFHTRDDSRGTWNHTGYSNARVDELIQGISRKTDLDQRNAMIAEIWNTVQQDIVYLPLHHQMLTWAMKDNIRFKVQSENYPLFKYLRYEL